MATSAAMPLGITVGGPITIISSAMSASEIIGILAEHHCFDITDQLDLARCERTPIACGGFGDIYRGTLARGQRVAIKCARLYLQHGDTNGHKILKRSARELHIWSRFEHDNVLKLLGLVQFQDRVAMVSPWMDNRTLLQYISRNPTVDRYQLCVGISEGVAYLHQSGLIHGDIKSANVLISNEGVAKISDFGCSELKTSTLCFTTTSVLKLSIRWAAPEILDGPVLRSREADVYALGMTLLEAVTGMVPFSSMQDRAVYIAVVVQRQIPKRPRRFPSFSLDEADKLWEMIVDTCAYSSPDRPSSITVRDRVRDVKHRLRQSMLDHSVIDFSVDAVEDQSDEGDDDDDYDEWDEWNEYDENDEYDEHESIQHTPEAEKPADLVAHASLLQSRLPPPKKPLSTWQLFFVEYLQNYKKTYPERKINPAREGRDAGAIYKALTSEQKEVYKRQSRLAKKNYQRELDAWVHTTHATQTVSIPTAWQLFFAEYLRSYKSSDPGQKLNVIHAAQDGGAAYRALTSEQKEMYKRKAVVLKKRFECGDVERTQIHASNDAQKAGGAKIRRSNSGDFHASKKSINAYPMSLQWILADQARVKESLRSETKAENSVLAAAKWRMLSDAEKPFFS